MHAFMNHRQVLSVICAVGHEVTVIVKGENGIGKTSLWKDMQRMPRFSNHIFVPPFNCTQMTDGSLWMYDINRENGTSREMPNERFGVSVKNQKGVKGARPVVVMFDETYKGPQYIKNMISEPIYERRIGALHFPENSYVFGATNLALEGLGDSVQPHFRSRVMEVYLRKPTAQEWIEEFAVPNQLSPEVIAFVHMYPQVMDSFIDYLPGGKYAGKPLEKDNPYIFNPKQAQDGFANPRSLHAAAKILQEQSQMDAESLTAALTGVIGEPTAKEMSAFVRFGQEICSFEEVVKNPAKAPISKNPTAQIVQTFQLLTRCQNRDHAASIAEYVMRMKNEMQSLFCHSVANSSKIAEFVTVKEFGALMRDNKVFFSTK